MEQATKDKDKMEPLPYNYQAVLIPLFQRK